MTLIIWIKIFSCAPSFNQYRGKYFNYEARFNNAFPRDNLPRIKDGAYVVNLDDKQSKGINWVSFFIGRKIIVLFGSFG